MLDNLPFSDDYHFVFKYYHLKSAPHPFVFFNPWSVYFKSWAFTYSVLWVMFRMFGEQVVFYRLVNLTLHFTNHLLFKKILERQKEIPENIRLLLGLVFLFHPLTVLTTSWIFQLKTLLAVFFFLVFYLLFQKLDIKLHRNKVKLFFLFWLSLVSKVVVIFYPLYLFIKLFIDKADESKIWFAMTLCFLCFFYGVLNIKGISQLKQELGFLKVRDAKEAKAHLTRRSETVKVSSSISSDINLPKEITIGISNYSKSFDDLAARYAIMLQNTGRFGLFSFGINNYFPFYEDNTETATNKLYFVYGFLGVIIILLLFRLKNDFFFTAFFIFLPISGLFYVPYMKFSYLSDHWFYPGVIFILLGMAKYLKHLKLALGLFLIIFSQYVFTTYKYSSYPSLLAKNSQYFQNQIIVQNQSVYDFQLRDWKKLYTNYAKLLEFEDFDNLEYKQQLYQAILQLKSQKAAQDYYAKLALPLVDKLDVQLLQRFNLPLGGLVPNRVLDLAESLDAGLTERIDNYIYKRTVDHLSDKPL